jgi:quinol monooxygenase YgiN
MAGVVHIPWYATGFRADTLEAALADVAAAALRYGARSYAVHRSRDDRYKFLQTAEFEDKLDWERYWNSPEMTEFRVLTSGWYQVPVLYYWNDLVIAGALDGSGNGNGVHATAAADEH